MEWYMYVIIGLLIAFAIVYILSFVCYLVIFYHKEKYHPSTSSVEGLENNPWGKYIIFTNTLKEKHKDIECESIYIQSYDRKVMHARYYEFKEGAPIVISCHGYKAEAVRDGCAIIEMGFKDKNFNVLVIDERSHGESEGRTICFGAKERKDVLAWSYYLIERFKTPKIILYGCSMGAATVLLAGAMEDLPSEVKCIIADAPYDKVSNAVISFGKLAHIHARPLLPFVTTGACLCGHFKLKNADPIRVASKIKTPTLLIHGEDDNMCPAVGSERIFAQNKEFIEKVIFPNSKHVQSYVDHFEQYCSLVNKFINKNIK